ncbi:MAG: hypothetical protein DRO99_03400 [Candidatus Aenigmatarchaeota archaeon]|nr:MAG: hypothetical protein DRO99_03400 [Candidatus Aenigmarchaeota archaeon]
MSMRKNVFEDNPFDERFYGWGCEDVELGYRLHKAGYRTVMDRECMGFHLPHDTKQGRDNMESLMDGMEMMYQIHSDDDMRECIIDRCEHLPDKFKDIPLAHLGIRRILKPNIEEIMIEVTNRCLLDCPCCCQEDKSRVEKRDMTLEEFKNIAMQANALSQETPPEINFCGLGEPLMNKHFIDMVRFLKENGMAYTLSTNGMLMGKEVIEALVSTGAKEVKVSLDAVNSESYSVYRVGGNFDRVISNIREFAGKKGKNTTLTIQMLVMSHNESSINDFIRMGKDMGADIAKIKSIFITSPEHAGLLPKSHNYLRYTKYPTLVRKTDSCRWVDRKMYINSDGTVMPCCFAEHNSYYVMGNAFDSSLKQILESRTYKEFKAAIREDVDNKELCSRCHQAAIECTTKDIILSDLSNPDQK